MTWCEAAESLGVIPRSHRGGSRVAPLATEIWYLPTYLIDNKWVGSTGGVSLFVRAFLLRERKRGPLLQVATDVWSFADERAMVDAIERLSLQELPAEAERDRLYVPDSVLIEGAKVEWTPVGVELPATANSQPGPHT